ncbi:hypothetical protein Tco_0278690 [Tanacetum coccineum]
MDDVTASQIDCDNHIKLPQVIDKLDNLEAHDLIKKAHIKWDIEGDENSKIFHGMINQKRRTQNITGIMHDGNWISDPKLIKDDFLNFFSKISFKLMILRLSFLLLLILHVFALVIVTYWRHMSH